MSVKEGQKWKDEAGIVANVTQVTSDGEVGYILEGAKPVRNHLGEAAIANHYQSLANFTAKRQQVVAEETSPEVASIAGKLLHDPDTTPEVRSIAASALTQAPDKKKRR